MFVKKNWKNREVQYPGRRMLTNVQTGETSVVDVVRAEGNVIEIGDPFSSANMDRLEDRIADHTSTTVFNIDGTITETYDNGDVLHTEFELDGNIKETYTSTGGVIRIHTVFNSDGSITREIIQTEE